MERKPEKLGQYVVTVREINGAQGIVIAALFTEGAFRDFAGKPLPAIAWAEYPDAFPATS